MDRGKCQAVNVVFCKADSAGYDGEVLLTQRPAREAAASKFVCLDGSGILGCRPTERARGIEMCPIIDTDS